MIQCALEPVAEAVTLCERERARGRERNTERGREKNSCQTQPALEPPLLYLLPSGCSLSLCVCPLSCTTTGFRSHTQLLRLDRLKDESPGYVTGSTTGTVSCRHPNLCQSFFQREKRRRNSRIFLFSDCRCECVYVWGAPKMPSCSPDCCLLRAVEVRLLFLCLLSFPLCLGYHSPLLRLKTIFVTFNLRRDLGWINA